MVGIIPRELTLGIKSINKYITVDPVHSIEVSDCSQILSDEYNAIYQSLLDRKSVV